MTLSSVVHTGSLVCSRDQLRVLLQAANFQANIIGIFDSNITKLRA